MYCTRDFFFVYLYRPKNHEELCEDQTRKYGSGLPNLKQQKHF